MNMEQYKERDEIQIAVWTQQRLNLERAIVDGQGNDNMSVTGYVSLLVHAYTLDIMLVRSPRRMAEYGLYEQTLGSLRFLEGLLGEIRCVRCDRDKTVLPTDFFYKDKYE